MSRHVEPSIVERMRAEGLSIDVNERWPGSTRVAVMPSLTVHVTVDPGDADAAAQFLDGRVTFASDRGLDCRTYAGQGFSVALAYPIPVRVAMRLLAGQLLALDARYDGELIDMLTGNQPIDRGLLDETPWTLVDDAYTYGDPIALVVAWCEQALTGHAFNAHVPLTAEGEVLAQLLTDIAVENGWPADDSYAFDMFDAVIYGVQARAADGHSILEVARGLTVERPPVRLAARTSGDDAPGRGLQ